MSQARSTRPPVVPPLLLKKISESLEGRTVGAKAALSPKLLSPPGNAHFSSPCPPKRRRASSKEFVHDLLIELQREHAYGPNKIIVGGNVARPPSETNTPRRQSEASIKSPATPRGCKENDCHVETVFSNSPAVRSASCPQKPLTPRCVNTPRSLISSGSNTPRSLFLEIDRSDCGDIFDIPMPCLQVRTSNQNTQTELQEVKATPAQTELEMSSTPAQTEFVQSESQTAAAFQIEILQAGPQKDEETQTEGETGAQTSRVPRETQTDEQDGSYDLKLLQRRILELEEEQKHKYERMKATALEEVMDLMTQMQRSHDEVEQMFSARIEELEERLREKEEECFELETAVEELDTQTEMEKHAADERISLVESRLESVSSSLFCRRSVFSELVAFIASRTLRFPAARRFSASLLSPGNSRFALECAPRSGCGAMLSAFSISVVGALVVQPDSPSAGRPHVAYIVRCVISSENENEEAEECELCVLRRFSELAALHAELAQKLSSCALKALPPLPPKRWFGACSERVMKERAEGLGKMFGALPTVCWRDDDAAEAALQFLLGRKEDELPPALAEPLAAACC